MARTVAAGGAALLVLGAPLIAAGAAEAAVCAGSVNACKDAFLTALTPPGTAGLNPAGPSASQVTSAGYSFQSFLNTVQSPSMVHETNVYWQDNNRMIQLMLASPALAQQAASTLQTWYPALQAAGTPAANSVVITSDALNSRKGGTEGAVVRPTERRLLIRAAAACAIAFLLLYLAARRYAVAASILGIILSACAYSVRPVRLKTRPVLDSVSNGFWVACIFCCGYYAGTPGLPDSFPAPHILTALLLCGSALHALTTLLDDDVDKKMGGTTIGVVLGRRRTVGLAAMLFVSCFFLVSGPEMTTYFAACSLLGAVVLVHPSQRAIHWLVVVVIAALPPFALVDVVRRILVL